MGPEADDPVELNCAVVLRFMETMDEHRFDALDQVLAPHFRIRLGATVLDRDQAEAMIRSVYEAFPDFTHHVEEIWGVGDRVVMRARDTATHSGDFDGIAASGKSVTMGQIATYRIEDGRIAEIWEQADLAGLVDQIRPMENEIIAEIKARFRYWCDTEVDLDMDAWAAVVTDDVVLQPPGEPAVRGFGALRVVLDDGKGPQEFAMKSMVSWRRVDGEWLVAANAWSADETP